ncbi:hypothetical protein I302_108317 [Kwoniella bestiolae CBS 10118]|uniref:Uncharacterized protein n=1 Tax=Kwoniella bestiolae CBS 10118 TaxID=1296100 RepID=A0A1B9FW13_9TREE|nr:hypothetical protein I302_07314 [Kwoniella bestiolae CBS 10118]OCF22964.1 hypothetical protein I302_07314 [Kwoniella bestiolae CBS 10118]
MVPGNQYYKPGSSALNEYAPTFDSSSSDISDSTRDQIEVRRKTQTTHTSGMANDNVRRSSGIYALHHRKGSTHDPEKNGDLENQELVERVRQATEQNSTTGQGDTHTNGTAKRRDDRISSSTSTSTRYDSSPRMVSGGRPNGTITPSTTYSTHTHTQDVSSCETHNLKSNRPGSGSGSGRWKRNRDRDRNPNSSNVSERSRFVTDDDPRIWGLYQELSVHGVEESIHRDFNSGHNTRSGLGIGFRRVSEDERDRKRMERMEGEFWGRMRNDYNWRGW